MRTIAQNDEMIRSAIKSLLRETFNGVPAGGAAWYTDAGQGGCLMDLLSSIAYGDASRQLSEGRRTIAAHVAHSSFHLEVLSAFLLGEKQQINWEESWRIGSVTEEQWEKLRTDLYAAYVRFERVIERVHWKEITLAAGMGAISHVAYHFGAIRQLSLMAKVSA